MTGDRPGPLFTFPEPRDDPGFEIDPAGRVPWLFALSRHLGEGVNLFGAPWVLEVLERTGELTEAELAELAAAILTD